jgi:cysteine sulfinate desulfinase/cysteine desulfurase-like protein
MLQDFSDSDGESDVPSMCAKLAKLHARHRTAAADAKQTEARARVLACGSLTEELRRHQKKLRMAVGKAKAAEAAAADTQLECKQLSYTNKKLQQELTSTQASTCCTMCYLILNRSPHNLFVAGSSIHVARSMPSHMYAHSCKLFCRWLLS